MPKGFVWEIKVPEERQRKEFRNVEGLADSIAEHGQIEPIIVDMDKVLIAGERRFKAVSLLVERWKARHPNGESDQNDKEPLIWYEYRAPKSEKHRHAMELEENIQREPLTKDEYASAVAEYHRLQQSIKDELGENEHQGVRDTAEMLKLSKTKVAQMLMIDRILMLCPHLRELPTYSAMLSAFKKDKLYEIMAEIARRSSVTSAKHELSENTVVADGIEWLKSLQPESVDLFLTDVMYGIDVFEANAYSDGAEKPEWDDSPETAEKFLEALLPQVARVLGNHRHALICCAWVQTQQIVALAQSVGLAVDLPPIVWHRGSPKPARMPTHSTDKAYEMIVHLYKGTPIFPESCGPNVIEFQKRSKTVYPTQKPAKLAEYLIQQFSLPGHLVCDPCHGSGEFLIAASKHNRRVVGCDINPKAREILLARIETEVKEIENIKIEVVEEVDLDDPNLELEDQPLFDLDVYASAKGRSV